MSTDGDTGLKSTELDVGGWNERWQEGKTGFHKTEIHVLLEKFHDKMAAGDNSCKVLVPLCGKSLDMKWLSDLGHTVVGIECSEQAIVEFFTEQKMEYTKETLTDIDGDVFKSQDGKIRLYRCDFFLFPKCNERDFDAVYDRASLIAINIPDRERYADVIKSVTSPRCRQLLVIVDYTKGVWPGPPHIVPQDQVQQIYEDQYSMEVLLTQDAMDEKWSSRGITEFTESAILLSHK